MKETKHEKHLRFTSDELDTLKKIMNDVPGVNTYQAAIEYIIKNYQAPVDNMSAMERKLNTMSTELDVLLELSAKSFDMLGVKALKGAGEGDSHYLIENARENVKEKIQRATTMRAFKNN